jgi:hypothetical protein
VGVLPSSKGALMAITDPFHDKAYTAAGWCDSKCGDSIVAQFHGAQTISCPTSVTSGTWDCLVVGLPWMEPIQLVPVVKSTSGSVISQSTPYTANSQLPG